MGRYRRAYLSYKRDRRAAARQRLPVPARPGLTYTGATFTFQVFIDHVLTAQLANPASNFAPGLQSLQSVEPQIIVLGESYHLLEMVFAGQNPGVLNTLPTIGHFVGFILN